MSWWTNDFLTQTEEVVEAQEASDAKKVKETNDRESEAARGTKRKSEAVEEEDDFSHDEVRLWEDGFKERYYESKFAVQPTDEEFRSKVACEYVRGLCWVLQYYYQVNWLNFKPGVDNVRPAGPRSGPRHCNCVRPGTSLLARGPQFADPSIKLIKKIKK